MNYKNKLGVLLCISGLMTVLSAHAQLGPMGISNDGLTFPDGSVQTAAASAVEGVIVVAKSGGDFTTISEALNSIADNDTNNRYQILVGPGEYSEVVTMKPYVDIVGSGTQLTRITHDGGNALQVVTTSDNSELRDLTVENNGSGTSSFALGLNNNGAAPTMVNVHVNAFGSTFNYAVYNQNGAHPTFRNVIVTANGGSSAVAMYHANSDSTSFNSSFTATDDANSTGFYMTHGGGASYTVTLVNSAVAGSQTLLRLSSAFTFRAAGSQLHGGGTINLNSGTAICVASFDGDFAALNSTCL